MRQLYMITVVWGEKFRGHFLNYTVPSLLSSGNLGSLHAHDGHRFLICTTRSDWSNLQDHPAFLLLSRHVTPTLIELDVPDATVKDPMAKFKAMTLGHRLAFDRAHRDKALASPIAPDGMFSDGTIANAVGHITSGKNAVLAFGPCMTEKGLFEDLEKIAGGFGRNENKPINLNSIDVVGPAIRNLHNHNLAQAWNAPEFAASPSFCYWTSEHGLIVHTLYFWYVMLDFATVERHRTDSLGVDFIERKWLSDNFPDPEEAHVITDSAEGMVLSWAPGPAMPELGPAHRNVPGPGPSAITKGVRLRRMWALFAATDAQKAYHFRQPICWRGKEVDSTWDRTAASADRVMFWFFGDVFPEFANRPGRRVFKPLMRIWWFLLRGTVRLIPIWHFAWHKIREYAVVIYRASRGDPIEVRRILKRLGQFGSR